MTGVLLWVAQMVASEPPALDSAYDFSAKYVPISDASGLQSALNDAAPCRLRLSAGDYSTDPSNSSEALPPLVLRSGCRIYGLPNTTLPTLIVPGGTHDVLVHNVISQSLQFQPGAVSSNNQKIRNQKKYDTNQTNFSCHEACPKRGQTCPKYNRDQTWPNAAKIKF